MLKEMSPISFLRILFTFTLVLATATSASACSRSLPSPSNNNGGVFTGGVQLLIPSWTFSCQGVIRNWFAHVTGNTSVGRGIEFQVLKPDPVKSNVYNLIYGNTYGDGGESATGSRIEITVRLSSDQVFLPIHPGYIVGVYIDSNAVNKLSLIYEDTEEDTDIYYWENLTGQMCDLTLCDAKVMRGVRPLIGWTFVNITSESVLSSQENTIQLLKNNGQYCNGSISATANCSLLPSTSSAEITIPSQHTSIISSQPLQYTSSSTSKEYFHTTTDSIEGKTSSSQIPSHSTSSTIQTSSTATTVSSTAATISHTATTVSSTAATISPTATTVPSTSPTALSNEGTSDQLFFILSVLVAALLITIIVLLLILIFLFGYKHIKRRGSERLANNKMIVDSTGNTTTGQRPHISTGVNPSYHQHSIIATAVPTNNTGREAEIQMKEEQRNDELVDSNKYEDIHVYLQPDPPHAIKAKLHTYSNVANNNSKWN